MSRPLPGSALVRLSISATDEEWALAEERARGQGKSISCYLVDAALAEAGAGRSRANAACWRPCAICGPFWPGRAVAAFCAPGCMSGLRCCLPPGRASLPLRAGRRSCARSWRLRSAKRLRSGLPRPWRRRSPGHPGRSPARRANCSEREDNGAGRRRRQTGAMSLAWRPRGTSSIRKCTRSPGSSISRPARDRAR